MFRVVDTHTNLVIGYVVNFTLDIFDTCYQKCVLKNSKGVK